MTIPHIVINSNIYFAVSFVIIPRLPVFSYINVDIRRSHLQYKAQHILLHTLYIQYIC